MARRKNKAIATPTAGWAVYLRTSSDENQKPELSRARQRYAIEKNVLEKSNMPVYDEYIDVLTGTTPDRDAYQSMLDDARCGLFSHVIVERADRFGRNDTEALRAIDELHEFGVGVRFANQPDLDPMDPDDRVIVALSFTLARRESALLGLRVRGGVKAKQDRGGHHGVAPDGYLNKRGQVTGEAKKIVGRYERWIEIDPDRAPIWRYAWDLLLEDRYTLAQICEKLHERGYHHKSGRPFVQINDHGRRKPNYNTLARVFHNWTYAGWVTSRRNNIPPKTIPGNWEPLVTTAEFERGLAILEKQNQKRVPHRKHHYLLSGLVYYDDVDSVRLTGSTTNTSRPGGGTAYYRIAGCNVHFPCDLIDTQIPLELKRIQVDPNYLPAIRSVYTSDIALKMGHVRPNERKQLEDALKAVDEEEARAVRLFAAGKITEAIWDSLWREWQDRRNLLRNTLEALQMRRQTHIDNLDAALQVISHIGIVYNKLSRDDKRELLRQMVERVIVDSAGNAKLELHTPFAYLHDISDQICSSSEESEGTPEEKETTDDGGLRRPECLTQVSLCGEGGIRTHDRFPCTRVPGERIRPDYATPPIYITAHPDKGEPSVRGCPRANFRLVGELYQPQI